MRLFASAHIPRTPFRVGLITGPFGGHHPSPKACTACGQKPKSTLVGWLYILGCMTLGAVLWHWVRDLLWLIFGGR